MRNLITLNRGQVAPEARTHPDLAVVDAAFDVVTDSISYVLAANAAVEVQRFMKTGEVQVLASFTPPPPPPLPAAAAASAVLQRAALGLVSFAHFADAAQLVFVFANGDVVSATYDAGAPDPDTTVVEIVGSLDAGVLAAAWAPDEETLALVAGEAVVLLLRHFEPISERRMSAKDVATSRHVSVGWGKSETQFTGKGQRAIERQKQQSDPTVAAPQRGDVSAMDSGAVTVSWRGDGEWFAVSTVEAAAAGARRRVIRVFGRDGALDSVLEAVDGVEHALAWKPQGALIAATRRSAATLEVVFFERNGLQHGAFDTRLAPSTPVRAVHWLCDLEVLALETATAVQLWTTKNYHWYLKQVLHYDSVEYVRFHPEKPLHVMVGSGGSIEVVDLALKRSGGAAWPGRDAGVCMVVDGSELLVTPLAVANVPPPISYRLYDVGEAISDAAVDATNTRMAVLTSGGDVHLVAADAKWRLTAGAIIPGADFGGFVKLVALARGVLAVAVDAAAASRVVLFDVADVAAPRLVAAHELDAKVVLLQAQSDFEAVTCETIDGAVYRCTPEGVARVAAFPQLCREYEVTGGEAYGVANGKLYAGGEVLASGVTSLVATDAHVLYTTQLELRFVHLGATGAAGAAAAGGGAADAGGADERVRAIERGLLLVAAMPSRYLVVLEAPRGNLETICPRIMVLAAVRRFIGDMRYRDAFLACRTHRIDLDLLHDYDPRQFMRHTEAFVAQLALVANLDLFVSCLHEEDVAATKYRDTSAAVPPAAGTASKVNRICDAVVAVLSKAPYRDTHLQTIVTAYACRHPPNLEGALELCANRPAALEHLCFLQDVNVLYRTALGLYDVTLALAVAQRLQRDPKEYLPFLQRLHLLEELRRKFAIDEHLQRYERALGWLYELGADAELDAFVVEHGLYQRAMALYKDDRGRFEAVLRLYAASLSAAQPHELGLIYEYLQEWRAAVEQYVAARQWRAAVALCQAHAAPELAEVCHRLVAALTDAHHYRDAAELEWRVLARPEEAVRLYCRGYWFEDAMLCCSLDLTEVDASLGEAFGTVAELLADCTAQAELQLRRLRELRAKKQEDPYGFYGDGGDGDGDGADNVLIAASETSTTPSFFTRYTGKTSGTAQTGALRKTSKNRKREERKRAKGRKGTIYEEEYLIKSVGRLVERLDTTAGEAVRLIEALVRRRRLEQARQLQRSWADLTRFLQQHMAEIHDMSERDRQRLDDNGEVYMIDAIAAPPVRPLAVRAILDY
jgi:elongator complex protein 1